MTAIRQERFLYLSVVMVIGMSLGIAWGARSTFNRSEAREHTLLGVPAPRGIQELVDTADIIVLGTITAVIDEGPFAGYDQNGSVLNRAAGDNDAADLSSHVFWRTDFAITPISILKGHNPTNDIVILREPDTWTTSVQLTYKHLPIAGQQLFFLTRNPDNRTYGASVWQKIILDGTDIRYLNADQTIPEFARNQTAAQLLRAVNDAITLSARVHRRVSIEAMTPLAQRRDATVVERNTT